MKKTTLWLVVLSLIIFMGCASAQKQLRLPMYQGGSPEEYANLCMDSIDSYIEEQYGLEDLPQGMRRYVRESYSKYMQPVREKYVKVFLTLHSQGSVGSFPNHLEFYRSTGSQWYRDNFTSIKRSADK